jgi:hypothetical protein
MPRKKRPLTNEEHAAALAKRLLRNIAFSKSNALVEIEWFQDGILGLGNGQFVKFINKRGFVPARYLQAAEGHGCRRVDVSREKKA